VLDLLKKTKKIRCKPSSTPIDSKNKLNSEEGEPLDNENQVSQFMHIPKTIHMEVINKILRYLKKTLGK
jgi:hypothetical protein